MVAGRAARRRADRAEVERAFADGEILRTHVMRPTWHFVAAEDLRWLLRLTAPRVHQALGYWYRKLELDGRTLARAQRAFARELAGGEPRTRKELVAVLAGLGIEGDSIRLGHLFGHAEVEQLIVSGPPRGKQQTYMLFDDRVPPDPGPSGDAALAELARRYFQSHGPATARDFSWWSGLTLTQARAAIGLCEEIERTLGDDETAWFTARSRGRGSGAQPLPAAAHLRRADRRLQGPAHRPRP